MSKIYMYSCKCKKNVVDKKAAGALEIIKDNTGNALVPDVHFKYGGNIMNIEIILAFNSEISDDLLRKCNYIKVNKLNRYYFVDDIEFLQGSQYKLKCSIDVLQTYSGVILGSSQMIRRNEYLYNGRYQDEKFPIMQTKRPVVLKIGGSPFVKTNMSSGKRCIAMTVSGGGI